MVFESAHYKRQEDDDLENSKPEEATVQKVSWIKYTIWRSEGY